MTEYRHVGGRLGAYIRDANPTEQQIQALLADLLAGDELLQTMRDVVSRPSFKSLQALAGTGQGAVQRDALLQELARRYLSEVVDEVGQLLNGLLDLPPRQPKDGAREDSTGIHELAGESEGLLESLKSIGMGEPKVSTGQQMDGPEGQNVRTGSSGIFRSLWLLTPLAIAAAAALAAAGQALLLGSSQSPPTPFPVHTLPQARPPAPPDPTATPPTAAGQLTLISDQRSWVAVRAWSGRNLFEGDFKGRRSFPLGNGLAVLAGRPDLLQVQIGGAPPRPLGSVDQVGWQHFRNPQP